MTENQRSKRTIRLRMVQTGEKDTEARRALLNPDNQSHSASRAGHLGTDADECLAGLEAHQAAWEYEDAIGDLAAIWKLDGDELRELGLLRSTARPVIWAVIKLSVTGFPGADLDSDAGWAAMLAVSRWKLLILQQAGFDAHLVDGHLRLIDLIESRIALWPAVDWTAAVHAHVQALVRASDSGRRRGQLLRAGADPAAMHVLNGAGWELRHPADHYFSRARAVMADPTLRRYLDRQIVMFAPSYAALTARDWSPAMSRADVNVDVLVADPAPTDWAHPVATTVVGVHRGDLTIGSEVGLRLVADHTATFNGTLLSVLGGERWLVCGRFLADATVVPVDGTRRLLTR